MGWSIIGGRHSTPFLMSDIVIRVENISKLYRLGEVGTGSLAHDVNRWWHRVRGREDPYLKIGEVNDRTKPAKQASADGTNHTNKHEKLNTEDTENPERGAGGNQRSDSGAGGALIALGAGFNPILTGREPKGWEAHRTSNRRLAQSVQRRRECANQNIYINGSVLGLTKKELQ